jgi:hypothetical protein
LNAQQPDTRYQANQQVLKTILHQPRKPTASQVEKSSSIVAKSEHIKNLFLKCFSKEGASNLLKPDKTNAQGI